MAEALIAGLNTHWRVLGQGPRPALALHCSLAHGGAWTGLAAQLPDVSLTCPDLPGHGRSDAPADPAQGHDIATAMAEALAEEIGAPLDIFGHSYGGTVALRLALTRPDLVRSLVLIEPVYFAIAKDWSGYAHFTAEYAAIEALLARDRYLGAAAFHAVWGSGDTFADLPQRQQDYMAERMQHVVGQSPILIEDRERLGAEGRLEALDIPVLLVEGAESPPVIHEIQSRLDARLPRATRLVVSGANHMVALTHAELLSAEIKAHLARS